MKKLIILISLALTACSSPKLPEPRIEYPSPPAVLMEPPQEMKTINENNKENNPSNR